MRKVIIYGTGDDAKECFNFFGNEEVLFFISDMVQSDNKILECEVLNFKSFTEYFNKLSKEDQYFIDVIIAINKLNIHGHLSLSSKMQKTGCNFSIWHDIKKRWDSADLFLNRNLKKYRHERESLYIIRNVQLSYLYNHINPCSLSSAAHKFREYQVSMVKNCSKLFQKIEDEEIKLVMCGGTLIGALRHKGFIPWDDDLDFAILYPSYVSLINKLESMRDIQVFYHEGYIENCGKIISLFKTRDGNTYKKNNSIQYFVRVGFGYMKIYINTGDDFLMKNQSVCDIFPIYYFSDSYTEQLYNSHIRHFYEQRKIDLAVIDKNYVLEMKSKGYIEDDSDTIGYGHPHITSLMHWYPGSFQTWKMCSISQFLPLQKLEFEENIFWAPANPKGFLEIVGYQNWQELPPNLPFDHHDRYLLDGSESLEEALDYIISRKG